MALSKRPDYLPNRQISATRLSEVEREVERLGRITAAPPLAVTSGPSGTHIRLFGQGQVLAKITGSAGTNPVKHSWVEQWVKTDGTLEDKPGGLSGSTTDGYAIAQGGGTIETDTVVVLTPAVTGQFWYANTQTSVTVDVVTCIEPITTTISAATLGAFTNDDVLDGGTF